MQCIELCEAADAGTLTHLDMQCFELWEATERRHDTGDAFPPEPVVTQTQNGKERGPH